MAFLSIDDQAGDHPKLEALSDRAFRLWFKAICYCQRYLTDGHIPADTVRGLRGWSKSTQDELVKTVPPFDHPLWHVHEDGSVKVHDFLDWNDSREEVLKRRAEKADRMKRFRQKRGTSAIQDAPRDALRPSPRDALRDAPRAPTHNHNHTVAKATGTGAPLVGRRNTRVLNESDPVQFPATLREEFQAVIVPRLEPGQDPYDALLQWVHQVSDRTVERFGGAPTELLGDVFGWWRARLSEDWGVNGTSSKVRMCQHRHTPPCPDPVTCSRRYIAELKGDPWPPVEARA